MVRAARAVRAVQVVEPVVYLRGQRDAAVDLIVINDHALDQ